MSNSHDVVFYNGEYLNADSFALTLSDRAFRYGDGLFETMFACGGNVLLTAAHLKRFRKGLQVLGITLHELYTDDYLCQVFNGVLQRSRLYQGAVVRMYVWRKAEGKFLVNSTGANILIEANYFNKGAYSLNKEGMVLGLYHEPLINYNLLSSVKSANCLPYILAGAYAKENSYDDVLMLNSEGFVTEATSSNLFVLKNDKVYTPDLTTGCLPGVMRKYVISILNDMGLCCEELKFEPLLLMEADEVFVTNAVSGLRWVVAYNDRRYMNRLSRKIVLELNKRLISE